MGMLGEPFVDDLLDPCRLTQATGVAAAALALEVVDEYQHLRPGGAANGVLDAVAAEDRLVVGTEVEDVRALGVEVEAVLGHQADVDAAVVVSLDEHRVRIRLAADTAQHHA